MIRSLKRNNIIAITVAASLFMENKGSGEKSLCRSGYFDCALDFPISAHPDVEWVFSARSKKP